jgi:hypothetical protein
MAFYWTRLVMSMTPASRKSLAYSACTHGRGRVRRHQSGVAATALGPGPESRPVLGPSHRG